jgi:CRISPR-associated protein Cmr2
MFPQGSWAVSFKFKLRKPYISHDDSDFYVIDNPVRKEWVFKMPYIAASQWKGALRAAMVKQLVEKSDSLSDEEFAKTRFRLTLLFGDEKGEELDSINGLAGYLDTNKSENASRFYRTKIRQYFSIKDNDPLPNHAGCIHFYPTYFTRIGLEVINPHNRETGTGIQPIYFECVPYDTDAVFVLLYVPLHRTGKDRKETKKYAIDDLQFVADGICAMMTQYGFGAKTSSGFGLAEKNIEEGKLVLNADGIEKSLSNKKPVTEIPEEFLKYLNDDGTVKQEFRSSREEGLLSNKEFGERKQAGGGNFSEFKKFRDWYKVHGKGLSKHGQSKSSAGLSGWEFKSFDELRDSIKSLAQNIKGRDDST